MINIIIGDSNKYDTLRMEDNEKVNVYVGADSIVGRRADQQDTIKTDTFYDYLKNQRIISILCDGMGGLSGGKKASELCSSILYDEFHLNKEIESIPAFFKSMIYKADNAVKNLKDDNNESLHSGTTMVCVIIEKDKLFWASVGDSRIYIIRKNQILSIVRSHNFNLLLQEKVKAGEITQAEASNNPKKEALISYIGIGGVRYVDMNGTPFYLMDKDCIILCSDGLYRSVTEQEIMNIVKRFGVDTRGASEALTNLAMSKGKPNQDNTSVIVIQFNNSDSNNI